MHRTIRVLLLLAGAMTSPSVGLAQEIESAYRYIETSHEAGIFAGTMNAGTGRFDIGPEGGLVIGAKYAIELTGPLSLEGVIRGIPSTRDVRDPTRAAGSQNLGEADVLLTSVDARLKFSLPGRRTWHGISPFVTAGGGIMWDMAGDQALDEELVIEADRFDFGNSFIVLLGAGVRWLPTESFEIRADTGFNLWRLDTPDGYLDEIREDIEFENPPPESEWVRGISVTLGAAIRW